MFKHHTDAELSAIVRCSCYGAPIGLIVFCGLALFAEYWAPNGLDMLIFILVGMSIGSVGKSAIITMANQQNRPS